MRDKFDPTRQAYRRRRHCGSLQFTRSLQHVHATAADDTDTFVRRFDHLDQTVRHFVDLEKPNEDHVPKQVSFCDNVTERPHHTRERIAMTGLESDGIRPGTVRLQPCPCSVECRLMVKPSSDPAHWRSFGHPLSWRNARFSLQGAFSLSKLVRTHCVGAKEQGQSYPWCERQPNRRDLLLLERRRRHGRNGRPMKPTESRSRESPMLLDEKSEGEERLRPEGGQMDEDVVIKGRPIVDAVGDRS